MNLNSTITLTYGDRCETHAGMEIRGTSSPSGFTIEDLLEIKRKLEDANIISNFHLMKHEDEQAGLLIIPYGVDSIFNNFSIFGYTYNDLYQEQVDLEPILDRKAFMRGRVVNKIARWNTVFDNDAAEPDYENAKGRVTAFNDVPITFELREIWYRICNTTSIAEYIKELKCEGNYYYDPKKHI